MSDTAHHRAAMAGRRVLSWRAVLGAAVAALLLAALLIGGLQWRYWQNWLSYDFPAPDRQLQVEKYAPVDVLATGPGVPIPAGPPLEPSVEAALDAYFARSGSYALLVARDGQLAYRRYAEGLDDSTRFDAWSMSKTMTAMAIGYALESGAIDNLDQPIATWIEEWAGTPRGQVTLRQLLNNESGLDSPAFAFTPFNPALGFFVGTDLDAIVLPIGLAREPGTAFQFNHVNSQLLVMILERATGLRYAEVLRRYLWQPLQMGAAGLPLDRPEGRARGVCCFLSNAPNWLKLGILLADGGRYAGRQIVDPDWIAAMTAPAPSNPNFGFSLWLGPFGETRLIDGVRGRDRPLGGRFAAADTLFAEGSGGVRLYAIPSANTAIIRFGEYRGFPLSEDWRETELVNIVLGSPTASPD